MEKIYDSAPERPDDEFWLAHGRKMVEESLPSIRTAASQMITGVWALEGIYLGIIGFAHLIPDTASIGLKILFLVPLLLWMVSLLACVRVLQTHEIRFNWHSPDDIQKTALELLSSKQKELNWAVGTFTAGILLAFLLILFYVYL